MALFDKLQDAASNLTDKAGNAIEVGKLKQKISSEKKAIEMEMAKIGRIYYEKAKGGEETPEEIQEICSRIDAHYSTIEDTEKDLALYKDPTL